MKPIARVVAVAALLLLSACGNKGPLVQSNSPAGDEWRQTEARRELSKLNRERAEQGLPPLQALPGQEPPANAGQESSASDEATDVAPSPAVDGDPPAQQDAGDGAQTPPPAAETDPDPGNG